jgi:hypothetical protein
MSRSLKSLVGLVALISAILFSAVAASQYWFLRHQLRKKGSNELRSLSEDVLENIAYTEAWNLEGYRRTTSGPDIYVIETFNGTLIDLGGYEDGMLAHVSLPFRVEYDRPFSFESDVGETWNLYVHRLSDGVVVLGVRNDMAPPNVNERFVEAAARFGRDVSDATELPERAVDESAGKGQ